MPARSSVAEVVASMKLWEIWRVSTKQGGTRCQNIWWLAAPIAVSSSTALEEPADDVSKPVTPRELIRSVRRMARRLARNVRWLSYLVTALVSCGDDVNQSCRAVVLCRRRCEKRGRLHQMSDNPN